MSLERQEPQQPNAQQPLTTKTLLTLIPTDHHPFHFYQSLREKVLYEMDIEIPEGLTCRAGTGD